MDHTDTLNAAQAATLLFVDTETVLLLARQGELPGTKIGKPWVFLRQDILDFLRTRIQQDTEERRRRLQSVHEPLAALLPVPRKSRRKELPPLPDLPVNGSLQTPVQVRQDRYRAELRNVTKPG